MVLDKLQGGVKVSLQANYKANLKVDIVRFTKASLVIAFMGKKRLALSLEKLKIIPIEKGIYFLGCNARKYKCLFSKISEYWQ